MPKRNVRSASVTATLLVSAALAAVACGNSTDDGDNNTPAGADGGTGSGNDSGTGTGTGSDSGTGTGTGTGSDGGTGTGTGSDGGTGTGSDSGGGGVTPIVSTCAPAKVSLGVEAVAKISASAEPDVRNVIAVDLNNDGASDLVGPDSNGVDVALSNKDGTFAKPTSATDPVGNGGGITSGDFDGDGYQDVLVSSFGSGSVDDSVDLLLGKGDGTFHLPANTEISSSNIYTLKTADFNGDGKLDFYYNGQDASGIVLNSGHGTFAGPGTMLSITGLRSVTFADLNGDAAADIVYFDGNQVAMCVGLNTGTGSFKTAVCYPATANNAGSFIQTGDINGDKILDVVVVDENGDDGNGTAVNVWIGKAGGTFNDRVPFPFAHISSGALLTDVNNDGKADLEVFETYGGNAQMSVFTGNADGTLTMTPDVYPFGSSASTDQVPVAVGDFAGNGLHGFAAPNDSDGNIDVLTGTCKP
jgi:hypothetical protein